MNNPSPLIPQGSLLDQKQKSRARVKIAVFLVLTIHGIGLLALLMQGCKKEPEMTQTSEETNNLATTFVEPTNAPPVETNDVTAVPQTSAPPAVVEPVPQQPAVTAPPASATEYTISSGDNFSSLAKKFHVSVKALLDANPGVQPTRLKIGQKINIPAPTGSAPQGTTAAPAIPSGAGTGEQAYTVVSGDSLSKIATHFGTTVKALRSLNNLKTDRIV
ncbi:MAG TPA: LysM peptidoglycan-binding domain-containing protein, partial [Verrucomicrobiae bacterium]|nr:LysM peptidoglycan-binding domain-containing protein [Verrucomicrobiae bacterium]